MNGSLNFSVSIFTSGFLCFDKCQSPPKLEPTSAQILTTALPQDWSVQKYLVMGAPASKLVLGIPTYGKAWKPENYSSKHTQPGIKAKSGSPPGPYLNLTGSYSYTFICKNLNDAIFRKGSDRYRPYAFGSGIWTSFDDPFSVAQKARYSYCNRLGGVMFWELSTDDPHNVCGLGKFPLINSAKRVFSEELTCDGTLRAGRCYYENTVETKTVLRADGVPKDTEKVEVEGNGGPGLGKLSGLLVIIVLWICKGMRE